MKNLFLLLLLLCIVSVVVCEVESVRPSASSEQEHQQGTVPIFTYIPSLTDVRAELEQLVSYQSYLTQLRENSGVVPTEDVTSKTVQNEQMQLQYIQQQQQQQQQPGSATINIDSFSSIIPPQQQPHQPQSQPQPQPQPPQQHQYSLADIDAELTDLNQYKTYLIDLQKRIESGVKLDPAEFQMSAEEIEQDAIEEQTAADEDVATAPPTLEEVEAELNRSNIYESRMIQLRNDLRSGQRHSTPDVPLPSLQDVEGELESIAVLKKELEKLRQQLSEPSTQKQPVDTQHHVQSELELEQVMWQQ